MEPLKVYKFRFDAYNYQQINVEGLLSAEIRAALKYGGSLKKIWHLDGPYVSDPRLKAGDFYGMLGPPILTKRATDVLASAIEAYGELAPFELDTGESLFQLSVTEILDDAYLDLNTSQYAVLDGVRHDEILKPAFNRTLLTEPFVFRLKRQPYQTYCVANVPGFDWDFHRLCIEHELEGLEFTEVWADN